MVNVITRDNLGEGFTFDVPNKKIHVGKPPVYFSATNPRADKYIQGNSWRPLPDYWKIVDDPEGAFSPSTGQYTIPTSGVYVVASTIVTSNQSDESKLIVALYNNGVRRTLLGRGTLGATDWAGFGGTYVGAFSAGDKIEVYVWAGGPSVKVADASFENYCSFGAVRIG